MPASWPAQRDAASCPADVVAMNRGPRPHWHRACERRFGVRFRPTPGTDGPERCACFPAQVATVYALSFASNCAGWGHFARTTCAKRARGATPRMCAVLPRAMMRAARHDTGHGFRRNTRAGSDSLGFQASGLTATSPAWASSTGGQAWCWLVSPRQVRAGPVPEYFRRGDDLAQLKNTATHPATMAATTMISSHL